MTRLHRRIIRLRAFGIIVFTSKVGTYPHKIYLKLYVCVYNVYILGILQTSIVYTAV